MSEHTDLVGEVGVEGAPTLVAPPTDALNVLHSIMSGRISERPFPNRIHYIERVFHEKTTSLVRHLSKAINSLCISF